MMESSMRNNTYYRAAIALNNIGIDLLHRHFYPQAAETLRDAIRCMNFHQATRSQTQVQLPGSLNLQTVLQKANHHLSLAYRQTNQEEQIGQARLPILNFRIGCPLLLTGLVDRNQELLSLLCPARIDDVDFSYVTSTDLKGSESDVFEFHTASVVMNLGLAYLCIAESHGDGMMHAVRLLEMSYSILDRFCQARSNVMGVREVAQMKLVLVLGLLRANQRVAETTVGASMRSTGKHSRESLLGMLGQLVTIIQSSEGLHASFVRGLNCAAAA